MTSIVKPSRITSSLVLFYAPFDKDMKIIFEDYAGELMNDEQNEFITKPKKAK